MREEFDIFISYKESEDGIKTMDSLDAKLLYDNFLLEGITSVFYAPETLKDIIGEWDNYIDLALRNSKILIVLSSEIRYINSEHIQSEWSRFIQYNPSKIVIPFVKNIDSNDLPDKLKKFQKVDSSSFVSFNNLLRLLSAHIYGFRDKRIPRIIINVDMDKPVSDRIFVDIDNILTKHNYLYFGQYPARVINKEATLNKIKLVFKKNEYGYIESEGKQYTKFVSKPFGPNYTFNNQDLVEDNHLYFFEVEPVKWRVVDFDDESILLLSEYLLDPVKFDEKNDGYENSYLRKYLNDDLLSNMFSPREKELLIPFENNLFIDIQGVDDCYNANYGYSKEDSTREALATDYAIARGAYIDKSGNGWYWTKSRDEMDNAMVYIDSSGAIDHDIVNITKCCARLLVKVKLS
ncbi:MAG: toll/interleukin-1 receptor domain-containing protein [Syntrophomonadaceae bacterium]|jgi:hypothetical protein|nr:toll/interleukin-1 receptor domain-containing protein [Syntrophomonadaceae bacterium]